jgi:Phosphotransferase enzyme family
MSATGLPPSPPSLPITSGSLPPPPPLPPHPLPLPLAAPSSLCYNHKPPTPILLPGLSPHLDQSIEHDTATEEELIAFCTAPGRETIGGCPWVVKLSDSAVMKFGKTVYYEEAANLRRAFELLDPAIVRIPRVYRYFERKRNVPASYFQGKMSFPGFVETRGYLVLEYIHGSCITSDNTNVVAGVITRILEYFSSICHHIPGPLAGGASRGMFWEDDNPTFSSKEDLEEWINTRLNYSQRRLCFKNNRLVLSHMDLAPRNILCLPGGSICLLDWASAGFYPVAFEIAMLRLMPIHNLVDKDFNNALLQGLHHVQTLEQEKVELVITAWNNNSRFY